MHWLTVAEGLPIGSWRHKAGWESPCRVCHSSGVESAEHALRTCPVVAPPWTSYAALRAEANLPNDCTEWHRTLFGPLLPPGGNRIQKDKPWDNARNCLVTSNTTWEILRVNLLWSIWVQKCNHELNDTSFCLGKALYHAWRSIACIRIEVYHEITRFKRSARRMARLRTLFEEVWTATGTFATVGSDPRWHFTPPTSFLPYHLATEVPRVHFDAIPLRSPEPDSPSVGAPDDFDEAIELLFQDVQRDLDNHQEIVLPAPEPPPPPLLLSPASLIAQRCRDHCYPQNLVRDSSPDTAQRLQTFLQQEIDNMLAAVERERHEVEEMELIVAENEDAAARRLRFNRAPYQRDELQEVVRHAQCMPSFPGMAALEMYANVVQQLDGSAYDRWMADGQGYFALGPRHPT
ncbi:hypothetical protein M758_UG139000 [Ceratodon purpureus]|nr:hypothetical protein M758_UG139000 [Ceratodon purpureus]